MNTITLEMNLPEDIYWALQSSGLNREELGRRAARDLAVQLYADGRLALGKAASIAGVDRLSFWQMLVDRKMRVIEYTEDDYEADHAAIERFLAAESGKA